MNANGKTLSLIVTNAQYYLAVNGAKDSCDLLVDLHIVSVRVL